jgi:hypothetical protein
LKGLDISFSKSHQKIYCWRIVEITVTALFSLLAIHEETSLKLPQQSVIERQLFIKCLSFPSFGRQVLNTFYIMYIVKLVMHVSLFQVYTLYNCKRSNCYFYNPSAIYLLMWFAKTYIQSFQVVSLLQTILISAMIFVIKISFQVYFDFA